MSFPMMTKIELISALKAAGVRSSFFDPNAMDAVGSCHFGTVKDDVKAGAYTFAVFIEAHAALEKTGKPYSIGETRIRAQGMFQARANQMRVGTEKLIQQGVVT